MAKAAKKIKFQKNKARKAVIIVAAKNSHRLIKFYQNYQKMDIISMIIDAFKKRIKCKKLWKIAGFITQIKKVVVFQTIDIPQAISTRIMHYMMKKKWEKFLSLMKMEIKMSVRVC